MALTLFQDEIDALAEQLVNGGRVHLNFTELENKRAVTKRAKLIAKQRRLSNFTLYSRTAHGSLLDPRYTVEGRQLPDKGLGNDYKHYTPKLYVVEVATGDRW